MIPGHSWIDPGNFQKLSIFDENRQNLGWLLYQIDPRQQKEDTGRKINKIDITRIPYFCWIRAPPDAQIRQRSKNRAPVIWVPEPLWAPRIPEFSAGGEGFAPLQNDP